MKSKIYKRTKKLIDPQYKEEPAPTLIFYWVYSIIVLLITVWILRGA